MCANRVYVQRSVVDAYLEKVVARVKKLKLGNGMDADTDIGPLVDRAGYEKVRFHVEDALAKGAALLVDATHDVGIRHIDVKTLDPDFLIFPTYKWVLGPYGRAFMYVAKRHQHGVPLEQTSPARKAVSAEDTVYFRDTAYQEGARRYDMGERDHFISMEMAAIGMEMMAGWGNEPIRARLAMLTDKLADGLANTGVQVMDRKLRAPHVLSLTFPKGMATDLPRKLAAENVYAAPRLGRLRISPHVYNDEQDVERFVEVFRKVAM